MPLVSVIIPTYNRATFIVEAVESVLGQTFRDFELIVVDDDSRDATPEVLAPYFGRLRYIAQPHQGPAAARNTGIQEASGEFIAFLDSDDLWLPEKLQRQIEFFHHNPDILICQTQEIWLRNNKEVKPKARHRKEGGWIFGRAVELCLISPSAVMMHRKIFQKVGLFDEMLPAAEDYDLWLRVTARFPVGLVDEPLVIKRGGHPDQLSTTNIGRLDKYRIQALVKLLRQFPLSEEQRAIALAELRRKCEIYAGGCRKRHRIAEAEFFLTLPERLVQQNRD
ncbi:glycosyltransferase [Candidatus Sumerlaeota bacterium]|nr:glycosyltransferase [Candidatus Sumerlaeota bacterium]